MNFKTLTVSATDLGTVLHLSARRVRQLAEDGTFSRSTRGQYPLAASVQAYNTMLQERSDGDDLKKERLALMRAQRQRIEVDNATKTATTETLDWQEVIVNTINLVWRIRLRLVATWLYNEINADPALHPRARVIASKVDGWIGGIRDETEKSLRRSLAEARRKGTLLRDYDDVIEMMGQGNED